MFWSIYRRELFYTTLFIYVLYGLVSCHTSSSSKSDPIDGIEIVRTDTIHSIGEVRFMGYDELENHSLWWNASSNDIIRYDHGSHEEERVRVTNENSVFYKQAIRTMAIHKNIVFFIIPTGYGFYDLDDQMDLYFKKEFMADGIWFHNETKFISDSIVISTLGPFVRDEKSNQYDLYQYSIHGACESKQINYRHQNTLHDTRSVRIIRVDKKSKQLILYVSPLDEFFLANYTIDIEHGTVHKLHIPLLGPVPNLSLADSWQYPYIFNAVYGDGLFVMHMSLPSEVSNEMPDHAIYFFDVHTAYLQGYNLGDPIDGLYARLENGNFLVVPADHEVNDGFVVQEIVMKQKTNRT